MRRDATTSRARAAALATLATLGGLAGLPTSPPAQAAPRSYDLPEPTGRLRPAPGHEAGLAAAEANCQSCHSVDYVAMQPPGKGAAFWASEVTKMRKVYHAPIGEADGQAIADYLAAAY